MGFSADLQEILFLFSIISKNEVFQFMSTSKMKLR